MDLLTVLTICTLLVTAVICFGQDDKLGRGTYIALDFLLLALVTTTLTIVILETQH